MKDHLRHLLPFSILVLLMLVVYFTNWHYALNLDTIWKAETRLTVFSSHYPLLTHLIFLGFYIISVCLVIPDSTLLTLLGGLLFPLPVAILYAVVAETVGAIVVFAIFKAAFTDRWLEKERPFFSKMRKGFQAHSASYLLFLRLSHICPFWLTNIGAAYLKIPYWTFSWTTLIGVIPLAAFLSEAGHNLSHTFAHNSHPTIADLFTTPMKLSLVGLGVLSLLPLVWKKYMHKKKGVFK